MEAAAQFVGVGFERLLNPGSIPELAVRRCVIGGDTTLLPTGPSRPPAVVARPDGDTQTQAKKGCDGWAGAARFIQTDES